jgi:hypothetical protein
LNLVIGATHLIGGAARSACDACSPSRIRRKVPPSRAEISLAPPIVALLSIVARAAEDRINAACLQHPTLLEDEELVGKAAPLPPDRASR